MLNKVVPILIFFLFPFLSYTQEWKDTLLFAHQSFRQGDFNKAFKQTVSAQRLAPDNVDLASDLGTTAYRSGDFKQAEKAFFSATQNAASSNELRAKKWHNIGNAQLQQNRYEEAIESYKNALRLDPTAEETRYNLAEALRRLKQAEDKNQQENQEQNENQEEQEGSEGDSNDNQQPNDQQDQGEENQQSSEEDQQQEDEEPQEPSQRIADKRMEKMLDELLQKEMRAKEKVQQRENLKKSGKQSSSKKW